MLSVLTRLWIVGLIILSFIYAAEGFTASSIAPVIKAFLWLVVGISLIVYLVRGA